MMDLIDVLVLESGEGEWGISLDGSPNPEANHYLRCVDREHAYLLQSLLNDARTLEYFARYFRRGEDLACPNWGRRDDGHYGPCRDCCVCRIAELAD